MFKALKFLAIALAILFVAEPAIAQFKPGRTPNLIIRRNVPQFVDPNLNLLPQMGISPSQAAAIAKAEFPGSKVLKVRPRRGVYDVTLVVGGNVIRVRVDWTNGSIL